MQSTVLKIFIVFMVLMRYKKTNIVYDQNYFNYFKTKIKFQLVRVLKSTNRLTLFVCCLVSRSFKIGARLWLLIAPEEQALLDM